jgi:hypothetical protein
MVTIISSKVESIVKFQYDKTVVDILKEFRNRKFIKHMRIFTLPTSDVETFKTLLSEKNINWSEKLDEEAFKNLNETVYFFPEKSYFEVQLPILNKDFYNKIKLYNTKIENNLMKFDIEFLFKLEEYCKAYNIDLIKKKK